MAKTLLILGAGRMQLEGIWCAKRMGLNVVAIDPEAQSVGFRYADQSYVFDLADEKNCLAVAMRHRIDGVMTLAADYPLPMVARIATRMRLPGFSDDVAECATNKRLMRESFRRAGVSAPASYAAQQADQALDIALNMNKPLIVKPSTSQGGRGITHLQARPERSQLEPAVHRALAETRYDGILIEEFIDGAEFSVEALTTGGETQVVAVTDKLTSGPPYHVEIGHHQCSLARTDEIEILSDTARKGIAALGIDNAASHTEIRLGSDGPSVMEIGARLGGGYIATHLTPLSTGVDIVRSAIQIAIGEIPDVTPRWKRGAAVRFVRAAPGEVVSVGGIDEARSVAGCLEADVYVRPKDIVIPLRDSRGRIGHVICDADDTRQAIERVDAALRKIVVATTQ